MTTAAILLAGGSATRLGAGRNKAYLPLADVPLLGWSLAAFERSRQVEAVILVVRSEDRADAQRIADELGITKLQDVVTGGDSRHASERAGLEAAATRISAGEIRLVAIHDAARPFVTDELLERILSTAEAVGGAIPALPVAEHLLVRTGPDDSGTIVPTDDLRRVQTPQAFRAAELLDAYRRAEVAGFSGVDTAECVERFSDLEVAVVTGDPANVKVTFAADLRRAQLRAAAWPAPPRRLP